MPEIFIFPGNAALSEWETNGKCSRSSSGKDVASAQDRQHLRQRSIVAGDIDGECSRTAQCDIARRERGGKCSRTSGGI